MPCMRKLVLALATTQAPEASYPFVASLGSRVVLKQNRRHDEIL
jgi:hypothetical protein